MDKTEYYLNIAKEICKKSTCLRRQFGAVLVKNDEIISTGYTGAPRGAKHCSNIGCARMNVPHGTHYELCRSVHAEMNAIISARRQDMIGATLYLYGEENGNNTDVWCCEMCKRMIINAGIEYVVCGNKKHEFKIYEVSNWIKDI